LAKVYEQTRTQAGAILGNLQGLVAAREAQAAIIADSEPLRRLLEDLQGKLSAQTGLGIGALTALGCPRFSRSSARSGWPMCSCRTAANARRWPSSSGWKPNNKSRKQAVNDANQAAICD